MVSLRWPRFVTCVVDVTDVFYVQEEGEEEGGAPAAAGFAALMGDEDEQEEEEEEEEEEKPAGGPCEGSCWADTSDAAQKEETGNGDMRCSWCHCKADCSALDRPAYNCVLVSCTCSDRLVCMWCCVVFTAKSKSKKKDKKKDMSSLFAALEENGAPADGEAAGTAQTSGSLAAGTSA